MGSLDDLQQVEPSPFLFAKIRNQLAISTPKTYVATSKVWLATASFVVLLLVNGWLIFRQSDLGSTSTNTLNSLVTDMHLYPTNNQPYALWSEQNY